MAGADRHPRGGIQPSIRRFTREPRARRPMINQANIPLNDIGYCAGSKLGVSESLAGQRKLFIDSRFAHVEICAQARFYHLHIVGPSNKENARQMIGWDEALKIPVQNVWWPRASRRYAIDDEIPSAS